MKIGILTFAKTKNFGAELQMYALYNLLKLEGYETKIINYTPNKVYRTENPYVITSVKDVIKNFLDLGTAKQKWNAFRSFERQYTDQTRVVESNQVEEIANEFDVIIVGSDQIWNFDVTGEDTTYFLPFKYSGKKIAYAASFGINEQHSQFDYEIRRWLAGFHSIGVRETTGKAILNNQYNLNGVVVLDPTLLYSSKEWDNLCSPNNSSIKTDHREKQVDYIAAYGIGPNRNEVYKRAKELSKQTGCPISWLSDSLTPSFRVKRVAGLSPIEFVQQIAKAKYVITDSFHGTCFSLIYNKQFETVLDNNRINRNSRILDLMREINYDPNIGIREDRDWDVINFNLLQQRKRSIRFLLDAIA